MPIFTLESQEGRLFGPLAFTKTFATRRNVVNRFGSPPIRRAMVPLCDGRS
jgi:Cu/Ag efflux pump CusA